MNLLPFHLGYAVSEEQQETCINQFKNKISNFGTKDFSPILTIFHPSWVHTKIHQHPFFEFLYLYKGNLTTIVDGESLDLVEGDLCLMNLNAKHQIFQGDNTKDVAFNLLVLPEVFQDCFLTITHSSSFISSFFQETFQYQMKSQNYLLFHRDSQECIYETILQLMITCEHSSRTNKNELLLGLFSTLLTELTYQYQRFATLGDPENRTGRDIHEIIQYITEHSNQINLSSLAEHFNYAPAYQSRMIKQYCGQSFSDILLNIRLTQAAQNLIETDDSIQAIMYSIGYTNSTWFIRKFRNKYGFTPKDYRKQHQ